MSLFDNAKSIVRFSRPTLRVQLTLLYSGVVIAICGAALGAAGLAFGHSSQAAPGSPAGAIASAQHANDVHHFNIAAAIVLLAAALIAVAFGWWIAGRLLRRLRAITATAREISASNLHRRLDLGGPNDELKELGQTLDRLFGRLEASFESQRHFVANASHELRTPLAGQRTLLQVALADPNANVDDLRAACEEAVELGAQQEHLIDALLTLATSERGIERWEPFDLAQIAGRVLLVRRQEAEERSIRIEAGLAPAPALGDPTLVEQLVANLVDNALRHNQTDGTIEVSTTSTLGRVTITVTNTGERIPPDQIKQLFQPFRQIGNERVNNDGHGLGLAIVQAIANAHEATITANARSQGGMVVEASFAIAPRMNPEAYP